MHRRIADRALSRLTGERSSYFARVIDMVERDHASRGDLHLVYLILAEAMADTPIYLPETRFIGELLGFLDEARPRLLKRLHSRAYVVDPSAALAPVVDGLRGRVTDVCFQLYRDGAIEDDEPTRLVFQWPHYAAASPYVDDEETDA